MGVGKEIKFPYTGWCFKDQHQIDTLAIGTENNNIVYCRTCMEAVIGQKIAPTTTVGLRLDLGNTAAEVITGDKGTQADVVQAPAGSLTCMICAGQRGQRTRATHRMKWSGIWGQTVQTLCLSHMNQQVYYLHSSRQLKEFRRALTVERLDAANHVDNPQGDASQVQGGWDKIDAALHAPGVQGEDSISYDGSGTGVLGAGR